MNLRKYDHIIWDWNGTLVDDTWLCVAIMDNELKKIDKQGLSYDDYRRKFTFPVKTFYESIGFDFTSSTYESFAENFIAEYGKRRFECSLQFGVKPLLDKMKSFGISHYVLSAYAETVLREAIDHYGITECFTAIKGLDNHYAGGKLKEGESLLELIDGPRDRILLIGDTVHDAEVARHLGIDVVLIANGHQNSFVLSSANAPVVSGISEAMLLVFDRVAG